MSAIQEPTIIIIIKWIFSPIPDILALLRCYPTLEISWFVWYTWSSGVNEMGAVEPLHISREESVLCTQIECLVEE